MNARDAILGAVRDGLRGASAPPLPEPNATSAPLSIEERIARFTAVQQKLGGVVEVVADRRAACARIGLLLARQGAAVAALSDAPWLAGVADYAPVGCELLAADAARERLLQADVGVTGAQWGVAETGTLVLASAAERHRLASLLPALHLVVLPVRSLLGTLGEAFAAMQGAAGAPVARTLTFVTGPSRTADIELTLVVGVHGPKALHVLLVADDDAK
ncbi:MAG: lactate utilization protein [Phycisphaerales bacterium]|jgi:L-lactate dehydrogenase complex protein LldG|nr:lactate utilization protein [Phycisphaerales bacterium]